MNHYLPGLAGELAGLDPEAGDERRALYDRARRVLSHRLQTAKPALTDNEIEAERAELEAAIREVESRAMGLLSTRAPPLQPSDQPITAEVNERAVQRRGSVFHLAVAIVGVAVIVFVLMLGYGR